ncbi:MULTISPECIES: MATE family efflux transporter [Cytobacillus]|uniref:Probable multidrug resistance protein NorM n=2 Tax=Cytobacillus TaxID=2675230 RepID=A0AA46P9C4_CYTFI|nr:MULTISPECIES: MATE family efflux transporter [Cytobacillus]AND43037.1 MATE family efflux transporter [Cytobacillus oceanisediminis 2691]MCM3244582.1 MATE family efflux transporter [Cytobacillus oceanisediminis]USK47555.1 MATE family efflux transporter [Cytobacillus oceanisediminis]UYG98314.1 MATE family efflux transporter [Cytobacillus firmus]
MKEEVVDAKLKNVQSNKDRLKIITVLAIPAVIENFFQTILGFVDTYFVSKIGLAEVSAVGVTNAVLAIYIALFMAIGVAANVRIANFLGANLPEKARHISQQSVVIAILFGLLTGVITLFFAEPLLKLMGIEAKVLEAGSLYFRIVGIPSIFMSLMFVLSAILRGAGDTKTPMKISIIINIVNAVLDYVLIFGFLFIPEMGIVGAALSTVFARVVGSIALLYHLNRSEVLTFREDYWKLDKEHLMELTTLGAPAAGERLVMRAGQIVYFGFVVALGTNAFAAHQIAGNIEVFSYMIGYGFATAATILVGQQIGAGNLDEARRYAKLTTVLTLVSMSVLGAMLFFLGEWAGRFFTEDQEVVGNIGTALKISGVFQPFLAVLMVLTGAFQGANNTKFPMYLTAIGMWAVRTLLVYLLGIKLGWGLAGVWIAIGADIAFRAIVLVIQFRRGKWMALEKAPEAESECHPQTTKETMSSCINNY